jgi:hypothetical protein
MQSGKPYNDALETPIEMTTVCSSVVAPRKIAEFAATVAKRPSMIASSSECLSRPAYPRCLSLPIATTTRRKRRSSFRS